MKWNLTTWMLVLFLLPACGDAGNTEASASSEKSSTSQEKSGPETSSREYQTRSGKTFIVSRTKSEPQGETLVSIKTKGFEMSNEDHELGAVDPVKAVFLADLDQNGFEELYLVTRSTEYGSRSRVYAFVSNQDESVTPAYVPEISEEQKAYGGLFDGFRGHNHFRMEDGMLVNEFPVYLPEDHDSEATGGERKVYYTLSPGEAAWQLRPVRKEGQ